MIKKAKEVKTEEGVRAYRDVIVSIAIYDHMAI
jgi:hypothetical protein